MSLRSYIAANWKKAAKPAVILMALGAGSPALAAGGPQSREWQEGMAAGVDTWLMTFGMERQYADFYGNRAVTSTKTAGMDAATECLLPLAGKRLHEQGEAPRHLSNAKIAKLLNELYGGSEPVRALAQSIVYYSGLECANAYIPERYRVVPDGNLTIDNNTSVPAPVETQPQPQSSSLSKNDQMYLMGFLSGVDDNRVVFRQQANRLFADVYSPEDKRTPRIQQGYDEGYACMNDTLNARAKELGLTAIGDLVVVGDTSADTSRYDAAVNDATTHCVNKVNSGKLYGPK